MYKEHVAGAGPVSAVLATLTVVGLVATLAFRIIHPLLRLVVSKPGQGPSFVTQVGFNASALLGSSWRWLMGR